MSYTIHPVLWAYQENKTKVYPVKIAITINRKVTYLKTDFKVHKDNWDKQTRQVINHSNALMINASLRKKVVDLEKKMIGQAYEGIKPTKRNLESNNDEDRGFAKFAADVRKDQKIINRVINYAGAGLMLSDINITFLRKFEKHEFDRDQAQNTVNGTFRYLNQIIKQAYNEKLIKENPFDHFKKTKYVQSVRIYLVEHERKALMKLLNENTLTGSMRSTLIYFLMAIHTGFRHSDWHKFKEPGIYEDGYLKLRAQKNKSDVVMPVGPTLKKLLKLVNEVEKPISGQKCNVHLKAIAILAKINKNIGTHTGRHSFGYLCASNRLPKSVTAELLGVTVKTVEVYYHLSGENITDQAAILKKI